MYKFLRNLVASIIVIGLFLGAASYIPSLRNQFLYAYVGTQVVQVLHPTRRGGGTGFYVNGPDGGLYIMTNRHVCRVKDGNNTLRIKDGDKTFKATVLKMSTVHDLCVIMPNEFTARGLNVAKRNPFPFEEIAILGHPLLAGLRVSYGQYLGQIEFNARWMRRIGLQVNTVMVGETSAPSYPGNSGSPVINMFGQVVGVLFAGKAAHINYIVPIEAIHTFLKEL